MAERFVAVVGAANVDIGGFPDAGAVMGDSNPGRVRLSMGGVGRNIACNSARLGIATELMTALGGDAYADLIRADCARSGVGLEHSLCFTEEASSVYLFIADEQGDMNVAVNDMGIYERLTPEALLPRLNWLNSAELVVLDANLPERTLTWLAEEIQVPLLADAVSAAKVGRLRGALKHLDTFKPNRIEAEMLTGIRVTDEASARRAAEKLLREGVRRVFITLGGDGVCCADERDTLYMPGRPFTMVNTTGAGDAFSAALIWARLKGFGLRESAAAGMAAASVAMESLETVSPEMCTEELKLRMQRLL